MCPGGAGSAAWGQGGCGLHSGHCSRHTAQQTKSTVRPPHLIHCNAGCICQQPTVSLHHCQSVKRTAAHCALRRGCMRAGELKGCVILKSRLLLHTLFRVPVIPQHNCVVCQGALLEVVLILLQAAARQQHCAHFAHSVPRRHRHAPRTLTYLSLVCHSQRAC